MDIHGYGYYDIHTHSVKMYLYLLSADIHLQYSFSTHFEFYLQIPTYFFNISKSNR